MLVLGRSPPCEIIRSSRGSFVMVIPRLVRDTGSLCISMLIGERGRMAGGREGALVLRGVDEAIVKVLSPISVMEPLALACLEKRSLLRRLERSSAPCLAPSFPEIGHFKHRAGGGQEAHLDGAQQACV